MGELILPSKQPDYPYRTQDGRLLRNSEVNNHHVFWEARQYKTHLERRFREAGGLVLPLVISWHNDLHANIRPPHKPYISMMRDMVDLSRSINANEYVKFSRLTQFVVRQAETQTSPEKADLAQKIATNLLLQEAFIDKGAVELGGNNDNLSIR